MNKETCSRLSMELPTGSSSVSYMVASQDNQVVEVPVKDFSGQKITVRSVASNIHCVLPVVCVSSQNILGVSGSLSSFPSRISFVEWGAYFSVLENANSQGFESGPVPQEWPPHEQPTTAQRASTAFEIGLNRAYEVTGETTPQPVSSVLLFGLDQPDSWYRFEPGRWPYLQNSIVTVFFSYNSRLLTAIRNSTLFLLAAVLGVAFQASVDKFRNRKN